MKDMKIQELSLDVFKQLGLFAKMVDPDAEKIIAGENVNFYRDMLPLRLNGDNVCSFSVCTVSRRTPVVDIIEYHNKTEELIMPLSGDIAILLAPATPPGVVPDGDFRIFRIPAGTMIVIKVGVWHSGPFVMEDKKTSILIGLPERTYANDCVVEKLDDKTKVKVLGV